MHAKHLQIFTTIRSTKGARLAVTTMKIWLHSAKVTHLEVHHPWSYRQNLNRKLMTQNTRALDERHLSKISTQVRTTDANSAYCHKRLASTRTWRLWQREHFKTFRSSKAKGIHPIIPQQKLKAFSFNLEFSP
jgi:hypothetical protein